MENNLCKICNSERRKIFTKRILDKYDVSYYECSHCGFIQTEKPYWLKESYSNAITSTDVGLVHRNIMYSNVVENIIYGHFDKNAKFLDFAGGFGLFTRIMRDKGFDFYHEDRYCENLFAKYFDISDLSEKDRKFELVTAFEMMEHAENPFEELDYIFSMADNFLFSTELVSKQDVENWWYLGTEHGQHVSFYTKKSLEMIAEKYGKFYYPNGNLHLITNKKKLGVFKNVSPLTNFFNRIKGKIKPLEKMQSKTWQDFEMVIEKEKNYD